MAIVSDLLTVSLDCTRGATVLCRKAFKCPPEIRQRMGVYTERIPVCSTHCGIMSGELDACQALLDDSSQEKIDREDLEFSSPGRSYLLFHAEASSFPCYREDAPP